MSIIALVVTIVIIGALVWIAEQYIPMPPPFKTLLRVVVILLVALWVLQVFGLVIGGPMIVWPRR